MNRYCHKSLSFSSHLSLSLVRDPSIFLSRALSSSRSLGVAKRVTCVQLHYFNKMQNAVLILRHKTEERIALRNHCVAKSLRLSVLLQVSSLSLCVFPLSHSLSSAFFSSFFSFPSHSLTFLLALSLLLSLFLSLFLSCAHSRADRE